MVKLVFIYSLKFGNLALLEIKLLNAPDNNRILIFVFKQI